MFEKLLPLLSQCKSLTLILTSQDKGITVTVIPQPKSGTEASMNQPLQLTGEAHELNEGFINAITTYSAKRLSLQEQLEATTAILEDARKSSAEKASKALKKSSSGSSKSSKTLAVEVEIEDEDNEHSDGETTSTTQTSSEAEITSDDENIFS